MSNKIQEKTNIEPLEQFFYFSEYNISIKAKNLNEAQLELQKIINNSNLENNN